MSVKKRFTIAPDLASGIRNSIQSASTNQGQLHYDMMPLELIEPDPNNPRKLSLSRNEILNGLNPSLPDYAVKQRELDALKELAESIKKIGIRNAIEVYKEGPIYRIITGERRYWAALLAGQKTVLTRINQKPDEFNLRYTQWVENINRQDLSLWEKLNNLKLLAQAHHQANQGELSESVLEKLLGISSIQAYRYACLLKADEKVVDLIQRGRLNNLKLVQELVSMKDRGARNQIISWIQVSKEEITSLSRYRAAAGKQALTRSAKRGQPIDLGKVKGPHLAKQLLEILLADARLAKYASRFKQIDWASSKAITGAFQDLFNVMEDEFRMEETA